jgi:hypothetical protein
VYFGLLGITVKKEAGKVVESSGWRNVVRTQATKEFQNGPVALKGAKKGGPKFFEFSKL